MAAPYSYKAWTGIYSVRTSIRTSGLILTITFFLFDEEIEKVEEMAILAILAPYSYKA